MLDIFTLKEIHRHRMNQVQATTNQSKKRHFGFLLIQNFSLIAYDSAIETLRLANHVKGEEILSDFSGNGGDLLHPCAFGQALMGANLARILKSLS